MSFQDYLEDLRLLLCGSSATLRLALLLSAVSAALDLASMVLLPVIVGWALTAGSGSGPLAGSLSLPPGFDPALAVTIAVIVLFLLRAVLAIFVGAYFARLGQVIRERVARRLLDGYLQAPYLDSLERSVAAGITTVNSHVNHFANSVLIPLLRLGTDLLTIAVLFGMLAWIAPLPTAGVALVLAGTGMLYAALVRRSSEKHSRRIAGLEMQLGEQISQALHGGREVRIYGAQAHFSGAISRTLADLAHSQARLGAIYWLPRALGELVLVLIALGYMAYTMHHGRGEAAVLSSLSALAFAGMRLLPAFAQSMVGISMLRAGRAVSGLLATELRKTRLPGPMLGTMSPAPPTRQALETLELEHVGFSYPGAKSVLGGIDLRIRRGESIGLIGRSGAGKSTLGDLLLGLLEPQQGTIRFNGQPCTLHHPDWWRRVGFVPQNPFIANQSLARNVAYGQSDSEIDRTRLWDALEAAQLAGLIRGWPAGVDTPLGDQGHRLSGGQRQRVAIARALYRQRDLLVLDEATSALDEQTEQEVIQALGALRGRVTTVVIAHRLSTLQHCDFVVELAEGRIRQTQPGAEASSEPPPGHGAMP